MTDPLAAAAKLRAFCGRDHDDELAQWVAAGLERCLEGALFNDAFGLTRGLGQRSAGFEAARAERDELIRGIASNHFEGQDVGDVAREISKTARRYASAGWQRDRRAGGPCGDGSFRPELFKAFQVSPGEFPLSQKQLLRILQGNEPDTS